MDQSTNRGRTGVTVVEWLVQASSPSGDQRKAALAYLYEPTGSRLRHRRKIGARLLELLDDQDHRVVIASLLVLSKVRVRGAVEKLISLRPDPARGIPLTLVFEAIGQQGDVSALPFLLATVRSQSLNDLELAACIRTIGVLVDSQVLAVVRTFAEHPSWDIRYALAQVLQQTVREKDLAFLCDFYADPELSRRAGSTLEALLDKLSVEGEEFVRMQVSAVLEQKRSWDGVLAAIVAKSPP